MKQMCKQILVFLFLDFKKSEQNFHRVKDFSLKWNKPDCQRDIGITHFSVAVMYVYGTLYFL